MKKAILLPCLVVLLFSSVNAQALLMDLSGFTANPEYDPFFGGVQVSSPTEIQFYEYSDEFGFASDVTFFNDTYLVESDASVLSFDYEFALGQEDYDDYFVFEFIEDFSDLSSPLETLLDTYLDGDIGHVEFDLSPYRGQGISLSWSLLWGGDGNFDPDTGDWVADIAGSSARIYNLDIAREEIPPGTEPVPEPATFILFGIGLAALARKYKKIFAINRKISIEF